MHLNHFDSCPLILGLFCDLHRYHLVSVLWLLVLGLMLGFSGILHDIMKF